MGVIGRSGGGTGAVRPRPLPARSPHGGGGGGSIFSRSRSARFASFPAGGERDPERRSPPGAPFFPPPRAAMNEEYDVIVLGTGLTVRRSRRRAGPRACPERPPP